jgi:hypothetical protein
VTSMVMAPTPSPDYDAYRQVLASEAMRPPAEWTFKGNPAYRRILEHVTTGQARLFIECARTEFATLWPAVSAVLPEIAALNDSLGKPEQSWFNEIGITCSPSNLRYLWHALVVLRQIDALEQERMHIVELGGGYGGLALYVRELAHFFKTEVRKYTIVDVPEAIVIQSRTAEELGVPLHVVNGLDADDLHLVSVPADGMQRFFVSAYGFAEFGRPLQDWYADRLVRHCQHGLLVWNEDRYWNNPVHQFIEAPLTIVPERPRIDRTNWFVSF